VKGLKNGLVILSLRPSVGPSAQGWDHYSRSTKGAVLAILYHERIPSLPLESAMSALVEFFSLAASIAADREVR
jgi:hypothetical protein